MKLALRSLRRLRKAIQSNQVSFPSQVPMFQTESRADIQWRLAGLYFVSNWSCKQLGSRYGLTGRRTSQILTGWVQRAADCGYLQEIPPAGAQLARPTPAQTEAACAPMPRAAHASTVTAAASALTLS